MTASESPVGSTEQLAEAQAARPYPGGGAHDPARDDRGADPQPDDPQGTGDAGSTTSAGQLLDPADAADLVQRWDDIQAGFVDRPRQAVGEADALVADLIQRLTRMFAEEHARLEAVLDRDDDVSTEGLRVGLQRYRDFFHRLLAA
jgi:hypothetical protein